jgi:hypothetical protein
MCCTNIAVTTMKVPPADPAHIAERMMYFLCSYWSDKDPEKDTDSSETEHFCAANFTGVIRLSDHSPPGALNPEAPEPEDPKPGAPKPEDPKSDDPKPENPKQDPKIRWLACYYPGHAKASQLAPIGNKGTGPEGKYLEILETKALSEITAGSLVHTHLSMQYSDCQTHPNALYLGRWFEFRDHQAAIQRSPQLVIDGILGNLAHTEGVEPQVCSRCRGKKSPLEYLVNIYMASEAPRFCLVCQWYRKYKEPIRKSRAKGVRTAASGTIDRTLAGDQGRTAHSSETFDSSRTVQNSQTINNNETFDWSGTPKNSLVVKNSQDFDDSRILENAIAAVNSRFLLQGSRTLSNATVFDDSYTDKDFEDFNESLDFGNGKTFYSGQTFGSMQTSNNVQTVGNTQPFNNVQTVGNTQPFDDGQAANSSITWDTYDQNVPIGPSLFDDGLLNPEYKEVG